MRSLVSAFRRNDEGTIVILSAFAIPVAMLAVGCAIDYSRATALRTKLQNAVDSAALIAARSAPSMTDQDLLTATTKAFKTQITDPTAKIDALVVTSGRRKVEITASAVLQSNFMGAVGYGTVPVGASATSLTADNYYEIALVMDNSGSMGASAGGASKMQSAKDAANRLIDSMMGSTVSASRTKFSVVPFTLAVNIGSQYASESWMDRLATASYHFQNFTVPAGYTINGHPASRFDLFPAVNTAWGGCVETRPGSWGLTDAAPSSSIPDSLFVPMAAPDEPGDAAASSFSLNSWSYPNSYLRDNPTPECSGQQRTTDSQYAIAQTKICKYMSGAAANTTGGRGPNYGCNAQPLSRLTNNTTALHTAINAMAAGGSTNLLEGFMWGWRTLSPNAPFADGKAYNTPDLKKVIILLTDGMNSWAAVNNHNKSEYSPFGFYTNARLGPAPNNAAEARAQIDSATLQACTNAKAAPNNVIIYTVGFSVAGAAIDQPGLDLLRNCATNPSMAYVANDSAAIVGVFEEIARSISRLRLSQ